MEVLDTSIEVAVDATGDQCESTEPMVVLEGAMDETVVSSEITGPAGCAVSSPGRRYQKYRHSWQQLPQLKDWLEGVPSDQYIAWCRFCRCGLTCHLKNLTTHATSTKHQRHVTKPPVSAPSHVGLVRGRGRGYSRRTVPAADPVTCPVPTEAKADASDLLLDVSYTDSSRVTYSIGLGNRTVGFIGAGAIAQACLKGLLEKGVTSSSQVMVSAPSDRNLDVWKRWGCLTSNDNKAVVRRSDVLVVAVKPQAAEMVFGELAEALTAGRERCFISFVTGWSRRRIIETLTSHLLEDEEGVAFHVIRCVPNLAISIGEGNCVFCCDDQLSHHWLLTLQTMFSALGSCQKVDESLADVYGGAFSCGTAFALSFVDALASGAVNLGVSWHEAIQMAAKTAAGAARMVLESGRTPGDLKRDVSAAGGNTLAGLMALQKAGLDYAVMSAVQASSQRAGELGALPATDR